MADVGSSPWVTVSIDRISVDKNDNDTLKETRARHDIETQGLTIIIDCTVRVSFRISEMMVFVDGLFLVHADAGRMMVLTVFSNGFHMKDTAVAILE